MNNDHSINNNQNMLKIVDLHATSEDLAYYNKIRDTIHGLDGVIVKVITDSVTMITGALTLSVLLYDKLTGDNSKVAAGLTLVIIAFLITVNSLLRIKLYSGLLGASVEIAKAIEVKLFPVQDERLTWKLEGVPRSGLKGEGVYLWSTAIFFIIELFLAWFFASGLG